MHDLKIGLKLWSTNIHFIAPELELYQRNVFNYIELFVVKDSLEFLPLWKNVKIPFVLHAPHSYAGLNLSLPQLFEQNLKVLQQVEEYFKVLNPLYVIFHPGITGTLSETINQLQKIKTAYPRLMNSSLIENKPQIGLNKERCIGYSIEELKPIINQIGIGFCLDFGHAIAAAASQKKEWQEYLEPFLSLKPSMFHLSDGFLNVPLDQHLHLGKGDYPLDRFLAYLPGSAMVSLETPKDSQSNLDDFENDVNYLGMLKA